MVFNTGGTGRVAEVYRMWAKERLRLSLGFPAVLRNDSGVGKLHRRRGLKGTRHDRPDVPCHPSEDNRVETQD